MAGMYDKLVQVADTASVSNIDNDTLITKTLTVRSTGSGSVKNVFTTQADGDLSVVATPSTGRFTVPSNVLVVGDPPHTNSSWLNVFNSTDLALLVSPTGYNATVPISHIGAVTSPNKIYENTTLRRFKSYYQAAERVQLAASAGIGANQITLDAGITTLLQSTGSFTTEDGYTYSWTSTDATHLNITPVLVTALRDNEYIYITNTTANFITATGYYNTSWSNYAWRSSLQIDSSFKTIGVDDRGVYERRPGTSGGSATHLWGSSGALAQMILSVDGYLSVGRRFATITSATPVAGDTTCTIDDNIYLPATPFRAVISPSISSSYGETVEVISSTVAAGISGVATLTFNKPLAPTSLYSSGCKIWVTENIAGASLEVMDSTTTQLRLSATPAKYADLQVNTSGDLLLYVANGLFKPRTNGQVSLGSASSSRFQTIAGYTLDLGSTTNNTGAKITSTVADIIEPVTTLGTSLGQNSSRFANIYSKNLNIGSTGALTIESGSVLNIAGKLASGSHIIPTTVSQSNLGDPTYRFGSIYGANLDISENIGLAETSNIVVGDTGTQIGSTYSVLNGNIALENPTINGTTTFNGTVTFNNEVYGPVDTYGLGVNTATNTDMLISFHGSISDNTTGNGTVVENIWVHPKEIYPVKLELLCSCSSGDPIAIQVIWSPHGSPTATTLQANKSAQYTFTTTKFLYVFDFDGVTPIRAGSAYILRLLTTNGWSKKITGIFTFRQKMSV